MIKSFKVLVDECPRHTIKLGPIYIVTAKQELQEGISNGTYFCNRYVFSIWFDDKMKWSTYIEFPKAINDEGEYFIAD